MDQESYERKSNIPLFSKLLYSVTFPPIVPQTLFSGHLKVIYVSLTLALGEQMQEDYKFKVSMRI